MAAIKADRGVRGGRLHAILSPSPRTSSPEPSDEDDDVLSALQRKLDEETRAIEEAEERIRILQAAEVAEDRRRDALQRYVEAKAEAKKKAEGTTRKLLAAELSRMEMQRAIRLEEERVIEEGTVKIRAKQEEAKKAAIEQLNKEIVARRNNNKPSPEEMAKRLNAEIRRLNLANGKTTQPKAEEPSQEVAVAALERRLKEEAQAREEADKMIRGLLAAKTAEKLREAGVLSEAAAAKEVEAGKKKATAAAEQLTKVGGARQSATWMGLVLFGGYVLFRTFSRPAPALRERPVAGKGAVAASASAPVRKADAAPAKAKAAPAAASKAPAAASKAKTKAEAKTFAEQWRIDAAAALQEAEKNNASPTEAKAVVKTRKQAALKTRK